MLPFARVEVGAPSTRRCRLCDPVGPGAAWRSVADVAAELQEVAAEWTAAVGPGVVLCGPEPFMHPSLPQIVAAARSAGFERIGIETDGIALGREENARGALSAGVRHLQAIVFAIGTLGDRMAGAQGAAAASLAGIERFSATASSSGLPVAVSAVVPVCRHNAEQLHLVVAAAARAGAGRVVLTAASPHVAVPEPVIAAACDTGTVNRVWVEVHGLRLPRTHEMHGSEGGHEL